MDSTVADAVAFEQQDNTLFNEEGIILYQRRWTILFVYSFASFLNACIWIGFAPIAPQVAQYYGIAEDSVDMFSLLFIITFVPGIILSTYIARGYGIASAFKVGSLLMSVGAACRLFAYITPEPKDHVNVWYTFIFIGQTLCGLSQPLLTTLSSQLASQWFGKHETLLAVFAGSLSNPIGIALGALLSKFIVKRTSTIESALQILFMLHALASAIGLICGILFFDENPPTPPSMAAKQSSDEQLKQFAAKRPPTNLPSHSINIIEPSLQPIDLTGIEDDLNSQIASSSTQQSQSPQHYQHDGDGDGDDGDNEMTMWEHFKYVWRPILKDAKILFTNKNFICLALPFALGMTLFNILVSLPNKVVGPFSEIDPANMTAVLILCGLVGSIIYSIIMEVTGYFRQILKVGMVLAASAFLGFFYFLQRDISTTALYLLLATLGTFIIPLLPLTLENGAESMFPMNLQIVNAFLLSAGQIPSIPGLLVAMSILNQDDYTKAKRSLFTKFGIFVAVILTLAILIVMFYNGEHKRYDANNARSGSYIALSGHDDDDDDEETASKQSLLSQ